MCKFYPWLLLTLSFFLSTECKSVRFSDEDLSLVLSDEKLELLNSELSSKECWILASFLAQNSRPEAEEATFGMAKIGGRHASKFNCAPALDYWRSTLAPQTLAYRKKGIDFAVEELKKGLNLISRSDLIPTLFLKAEKESLPKTADEIVTEPSSQEELFDTKVQKINESPLNILTNEDVPMTISPTPIPEQPMREETEPNNELFNSDIGGSGRSLGLILAPELEKNNMNQMEGDESDKVGIFSKIDEEIKDEIRRGPKSSPIPPPKIVKESRMVVKVLVYIAVGLIVLCLSAAVIIICMSRRNRGDDDEEEEGSLGDETWENSSNAPSKTHHSKHSTSQNRLNANFIISSSRERVV